METVKVKTRKRVLEEKTENLIAIGAAMAANCIPCFEHLYEKAISSGISCAEIKWAAEIAGRVKKGANTALKNYVYEFIGMEESHNTACGKTAKTSCCC